MMKIVNVLNLLSGRIFLLETGDGYLLEATEMRDVTVGGKQHEEVRNTLDPHVVWKHLVPYEDKWLLTVSTQKGCVHDCQFCDVASLPFKGNLSSAEIEEQVTLLLQHTDYVLDCDKAKIGFARMGEPAHNLNNVLLAMRRLSVISGRQGKTFRWLPCFNSILPRVTTGDESGFGVIDAVLDLKENFYEGFLHFQISCNSTDEVQRRELFGGADVLTLPEIVKHISGRKVTDRTVTLNFIVMQGVEVDVDKLMRMGLTPDKFIVKLIPLNDTVAAQSRRLKTYANYENYDDLTALGEKFEAHGIPVTVDAIAKCEEAGLCCGQLAQIFQ